MPKRAVLLLLVVVACGRAAAPPPPPRAVVLTPHDADEPRIDEPDSLIERALAAHARGDDDARELLARALVAAEAGGPRARPIAPWPQSWKALSSGGNQPRWSPRSSYVWIQEPMGQSGDELPSAATIFDVRTLRTLHIEPHARMAYSPDEQYIASVRPSGHDRHTGVVSVTALATGREVVTEQTTTLQFRTDFAPDGRFVRAERANGEDRVYLAALPDGRVESLRGPAAPSGNPIDSVLFGREYVVGVASDRLQVWRHTKLLASLDTLPMDPWLDETRVVRVVPRSGGGRLAFFDVDAPERGDVTLPDAGAFCSDGIVDEYAMPVQCSPGRFAVASHGRVCVWNLPGRRLEQSFRVSALSATAALLTCKDDTIEIGDKGVGYTEVFSLKTGARIRTYERGVEVFEDVLAVGQYLYTPGGLRVESPTGPPVALEGAQEITDGVLSPDGRHVASIGRGAERAAVWDAKTGERRWRAGQSFESHVATFDPVSADLIIGSLAGATWRLDFKRRRLRTTQAIENCLAIGLGSTAAGQALIECGAPPDIYREGTARAILPGIAERDAQGGPGVVLAGGSVAYLRDGAVTILPALAPARAWSVATPAGAQLDLPVFSITQTGEHAAILFNRQLSLYRRGRIMWTVESDLSYLAASDDKVATCNTGALVVRGARGTVLERRGPLERPSRTSDCVIAFDPSGKRLARAIDSGIEIYALGAGATQQLPTAERFTSEIRSIAWSPDGKRIAAVADRKVFVWDVAAGGRPMTIFVASGSAAVINADDSVQLFGDADGARALLGCRIGARLYPYALCEHRFEL